MDWTKLFAGGKRIIDWLKSKNPLIVTIFLLFGIIVLQQSCPRRVYVDRPVNQIVYVDKVVTHYDTIVKNVYKDKFYYDTIIVTEFDTIVDSRWCTELLKDYFSIKYITDTLANDTTLFATAQYRINRNALLSRNFNYQSRIKSEYITNVTVVNPPKNKVYATLDIGGGVNRFEIDAGLMLQTKTDKIYSVRYDPINKEVSIGTAFKLFQYGNTKRN